MQMQIQESGGRPRANLKQSLFICSVQYSMVDHYIEMHYNTGMPDH